MGEHMEGQKKFYDKMEKLIDKVFLELSYQINKPPTTSHFNAITFYTNPISINSNSDNDIQNQSYELENKVPTGIQLGALDSKVCFQFPINLCFNYLKRSGFLLRCHIVDEIYTCGGKNKVLQNRQCFDRDINEEFNLVTYENNFSDSFEDKENQFRDTGGGIGQIYESSGIPESIGRLRRIKNYVFDPEKYVQQPTIW